MFIANFSFLLLVCMMQVILKKYFSFLFILLGLICSFSGYSQQFTTELESYDCTYSKEIMIPFNRIKNSNQLLEKPPLSQVIFYSHRDQYSYWYKVIVQEDGEIGFIVDPIDKRDDYAVFVYQYNQNDFCNKVYNDKIQALKPSFFINKKEDANTFFDFSEKRFFAKKDNVYYVSVLNTSINNCGHFLRLYRGKDTLKIKAMHVPCTRDVSIASKKANLNLIDSTGIASAKKSTIKKDTLKVVVKNTIPAKTNKGGSKVYVLVKSVIIDTVSNAHPGDAKLKIIDELTGDELMLDAIGKGVYRFNVEPERNYKVICSAIGYKQYDHSVNISDELKSSENIFEINLIPLKRGDNFIMKNVYFHPNTYALRKESEVDLQKLLSYLLANESIQIEIQGHTNGDRPIRKNKAYETLGEEWNFSGTAKSLSKMRAENIKKYLIENGVDGSRLEAKGYGGERMIISNPLTIEEGQENIRVEIVIIAN